MCLQTQSAMKTIQIPTCSHVLQFQCFQGLGYLIFPYSICRKTFALGKNYYTYIWSAMSVVWLGQLLWSIHGDQKEVLNKRRKHWCLK